LPNIVTTSTVCNTLAVLFEPLPAEVTRQVRGGFTSANDPEQMIGDLVQEVTPDGRSSMSGTPGSISAWRKTLFARLKADESGRIRIP
jgi:hypothetical protein